MSSDLADNLLKKTCSELKFDYAKIRSDIDTNGLQSLIVSLVFNLINRPIENSYLAGAILMWDLYKNSPVTVLEYANLFKDYFRPDVYKFLIENASELQKHIVFERDFKNTYFSSGTMISNYLSRLRFDQEPKEIPQFAYLRIAVGKFCNDGLDKVLKCYFNHSNRIEGPSSPTIFNLGFEAGAPASCMIYSVDDSLDDILSVNYEMGLAAKRGAGFGVDLNHLRHSAIGRKGTSNGVIPLMKIIDDQIKYVNQGSNARAGAGTAFLHIYHYDVPEFIRTIDKTNEDDCRVSKLNLSLMICDLFMMRFVNDSVWHLFCPKQAHELVGLYGKEFEKVYLQMEEHAEKWTRYKKYRSMLRVQVPEDLRETFTALEAEFKDKPIPREVESRKIYAEKLMNSICDMEIKSGGPYIIYSCNTNRKNSMKNIGPVMSSNLCQEIMIPAIPKEHTGCCNLSAICLSKFASKGEFDFLQLADSVRFAVVGLNRLIDNTLNVSDKVKRSNNMSRPLGIGVSDFASMLHIMDLPIVDSDNLPRSTSGIDYSPRGLLLRTLNPKVQELNWKIWSCMYYNALLSSMNEAKILGPCPGFKGSPASEGKLQFHMWQEEEKETGRKYPFKLYPAEPSEWEQSGSWQELIEDIKTFGLRNLLLLSVQPTASSAQIIGATESVELHTSNIYSRRVASGDYPIVNQYLVRDLEEINLWNSETYNNIVNNDGSVLNLPEKGPHVERIRFIKEKYLTMWEVPQKIIIQLAAQRQVFICHSQSMNLFIPHPTIKLMSEIHKYTWQMGLKTGMYYLRSKAFSEPLKIGSGTVRSINQEHIVDEIRQAAKGYNKDNKKSKDLFMVEKYDDQLIRLVEIAEKEDKAEEIRLEKERNEIISKALEYSARPELYCTKNKDCISCSS